jgi:predicted nucleic acid-binding protein
LSTPLEKLRQSLRRLGPSEELLREARLALSSNIGNLLEEARKLEEKRTAALKKEAAIARKRKPRKLKREEIKGYEIPPAAPSPIMRPTVPLLPPKIYIDTAVFLNVFKNEQPCAKSSERLLKAVEVGCLRGLSSDYSKVEITTILKKKELCEIAFEQINRWKVKIVDVTDHVKLNLLIVRNYMHDIYDLIHASTALTEHVDALTTRNIEDFVGLQRYFLVWLPEKIIEQFNVEDCIAKKI